MLELLQAMMWNNITIVFVPTDSTEKVRIGVLNNKTSKKYSVEAKFAELTEERLEIIIQQMVKHTK